MRIISKKAIGISMVLLMVMSLIQGAFVLGGDKASAAAASEWQSVGYPMNWGNYVSLKVYKGIPYEAFVDTANGNKATVMKFTGAGSNGWEAVGSTGFSSGKVQYTSLFINNEGILYVAYCDVENGNKATVMKFTGVGLTGWEQVGKAFSAGWADYTSLFIDNEGTPYVAYTETDNSNTAAVMKFTGDGETGWEPVPTSGMLEGKAYNTALYIDEDILYLAYVKNTRDKFGGGIIEDTVMRFDNDDQTWVQVGSVDEAMKSNQIAMSVFEGIPYLAVSNNGTAIVKKFSGTGTSGWESVGNANFTAADFSNVSLDIDNNGKLYLAYSVAGTDKTMVMKYSGGEWGSVGSSLEKSSSSSLYLYKGMPYLALENYNSKSSVLQFALQAPTLTVDMTNYSASKDIGINFLDDGDWSGSISAVKDGNKELTFGKDYSIISGKIMIKAGVLSTGFHSIWVTADNYGTASVELSTRGGTGIESDPYQIANDGQLNEIRLFLQSDLYFKLTSDIDLSSYTTDKGWEPIADFKGNLDGDGFKIMNLTINRSDYNNPNSSNIGLFANLSNPNTVINHIILQNINVKGIQNVGGLAGSNAGTISNSHSTGIVAGSSVGGLVGLNEGTISNSYSTANVDGSSNVGGLVSTNNGIINRSYASGNVKTTYEAGGLVGNNNNEISDSYAMGNVNGYYGIGGLVGSNSNKISNSYAIGAVSGNSYYGGLVGSNSREELIKNSFYDKETTLQTDIKKGIGQSTDEMKTQSTYTNWNFSNLWGIKTSRNNGYPYLRDVQLYVDYDGNGSTGGITPSDDNVYQQGTTVSIQTPGNLVKEGYTFNGWNTSANGSGVSYAAATTFKIGSGVTLFAQWLEFPPLSNLQGDQGTLSPAFTPANLNYTLYVANEVSSINLILTKLEPTSTISVSGADFSSETNSILTYHISNLKVGSNLVQFEVTTLKNTKHIYTINISRGTSSNADLSSLSVSGGTLSPAFNLAITNYTQSVANSVASVSVIASVSDSVYASVTASVYKDNVIVWGPIHVTNGLASSALPLSIGSNLIVLNVTAQDLTTKSYTVIATRETETIPDIPGKVLSSPTPLPTPIATPAPTPVATPVANPNQIIVDSIVTVKGGTVQAIVDPVGWKNAQTKANSDASGKTTINLEIKEVKGATEYIQQLPNGSISGNKAPIHIEIKTAIASINVPSNMFKGAGSPVGDVSFKISQVDINSLTDAVKKKVGDHPIIELNVQSGDRIVNWSNPAAPVSVSIPYTPTALELKNPEHIVIFYIDGKGNIISMPSGIFDPKTGLVTFTTSHFSTFAVSYVEKTFADVAALDWAKDQIGIMASKGIINGTSDSQFSPEQAVTRADFLVLLVRALDLQGELGQSFADVPADKYYSDSIRIARQLGITSGDEKNRFNPNAKITREDMMVLSNRALNAVNKQLLTDSSVNTLANFSDKASISGYAVDSVIALEQAGLIQGFDNAVYPKAATTRAQSAVLIYKLYSYIH